MCSIAVTPASKRGPCPNPRPTAPPGWFLEFADGSIQPVGSRIRSCSTVSVCSAASCVALARSPSCDYRDLGSVAVVLGVWLVPSIWLLRTVTLPLWPDRFPQWCRFSLPPEMHASLVAHLGGWAWKAFLHFSSLMVINREFNLHVPGDG